MQFTVSGTNKETGARMALQFEAISKAAAEKKAAQSGMDVLHCVPTRGATEEAMQTAAKPAPQKSVPRDELTNPNFSLIGQRSRLSKLFRKVAVLVILLALAYVIIAIFFPALRHFHLSQSLS